MGRLRRNMFGDYHSEEYSSDERYNMAYKRVKRIKGFYVHLLVYIIVNAFIIISNNHIDSFKNGTFFRWETFSTAFFWGIGLVAHGLSVFGRNFFFSKNWEEKKIREFMEKEKREKWE